MTSVRYCHDLSADAVTVAMGMPSSRQILTHLLGVGMVRGRLCLLSWTHVENSCSCTAWALKDDLIWYKTQARLYCVWAALNSGMGISWRKWHSWSIPSDEFLHYLLMVFMDPVSKAEFI